ncbi:MAG: hypothetical protein JWL64_53 [Frankiales bacterium]|nr:hypothetical protein [Frankiales bacterium]
MSGPVPGSPLTTVTGPAVVTSLGSGARSVRVALLWHDTGSGNLGVQALTAAHLGILERAAARAGVRLDLVWAGNDAALAREAHNVVLADLPKELAGRGPMASALRDCEVAFDIGEGDSFADIYGRRRLARVMGLRTVVQRLRIPVIMAPQTVGPFGSEVSRRWAGFALQHAQHVWTRDLESFGAVRVLAPKARTSLASDVAFRLTYEPPPARVAARPRIGVVPSGLLASGKGLGLALATDYPAFIEQLVAQLGEAGEVHLVPHVLGRTDSHDSDVALCERLAARHPGTVLAPSFVTASEAKSYLAGLDVVLSSRMHACVGAISAGVPALPLAYSPKFFGLFASLGYDAQVDLRTAGTSAAVQASVDFVAEADTWRLRAVEALALAKSRLEAYEDSVVEVLGG